MDTLKKRLEFVITLSLFFPIILAALFNEAPSALSSNQIVLMWSGLVIAVLLLNYILIEVIKEKLNASIVKFLGILLLIESFFFAVVIFLLALVQKGPISTYYIWPFKISALGMVAIPVAIFVLLVGNVIWLAWKPIVKK